MAIEKMVHLNLVGSLDQQHDILEKLILCERIHLDLDHIEKYDNNYMIQQYKALMPQGGTLEVKDYGFLENQCINKLQEVSVLAKGLGVKLKTYDKNTFSPDYNIEAALTDLSQIQMDLGTTITEMEKKNSEIEHLDEIKESIIGINIQQVDFEKLNMLHYFHYKVGMLSKENTDHVKKNYENISAVLLRIGSNQKLNQEIYLTIYPSEFEDETERLLKSLNWVNIEVPEEFEGTPSEIIKKIEQKISILQNQLLQLKKIILDEKEKVAPILQKIYTEIRLEQKILGLEQQIIAGNNVFVINAWVKEVDVNEVEALIGDVTDKFILIIKQVEELDENIVPPTELKNNKFFKPFESIVQMYGLPSYEEIDPTPFLAITFCLMFGIMFGDIGQGAIYVLAGYLLAKKSPMLGGVLLRLGSCSVVFGFIYGSLFGLEQEELPWLPSLIGKPLDPANIPTILIAGIVFGVVALTVSFVFGIVNSLRKKDIEEGIFGKNGIVGYIFFISFIMIALTITKIVPLPVWVPILTLVISLGIMIVKEPLSNLILGNRPLIHGDKGSYYTESAFEGVETTLGAFSNAISFIRVGAFALNHAGLFLAFLKMSEMVPFGVGKILILIIGNILILTLEGLVVFIQGLRLEYYEMFSKYFKGEGAPYKPLKLED